MKIFKTIVLLLVLGLGGFFYMNPYMMKPVLAEVSNLKELIVSFIYTDDSKVNKNEAVVINTYIIDPNIENRDGYAVDSRIKDMYTEVSTEMIKRDKEIRERLLFIQDKSSEDIAKAMAALEPVYEKERAKVDEYCQNGSEHCLVEVSLTGNTVEGSDVKMNVRYLLDPESKAFFNEVNYVDQESDKWYEAKLVSINEKRYYPQTGKFQGREQNSLMHDDKTVSVDVSHVLEGNSNQ